MFLTVVSFVNSSSATQMAKAQRLKTTASVRAEISYMVVK